jgi:hypothetical protein
MVMKCEFAVPIRVRPWALAALQLAAFTVASAEDTLPRADAARLERRIQELGRFGANPEGGVSRVAFSDADIAGWIPPATSSAAARAPSRACR